MGWFSGSKPKVKVLPTLSPHQYHFGMPILLSYLTGGQFKPSEMGNIYDLITDIREGRFDELPWLDPKRYVYQGPRVAELTGTQQSLLGEAAGLTGNIANPLTDYDTAVKNVLARRGLAGEPVGEQGPERVTARTDTYILPSLVSPLGQVSNSPVAESNDVGADSEQLKRRWRLPGFATGGYLPRGKSAVVGERGPETAIPVNPLMQQTRQAAGRALSGRPSVQVNPQTTEQYIQKAIAEPLRKQYAENTRWAVRGAYAGPGFWGSSRAKAETKAAQDTEQQIAALAAQARYADEQARRQLAESAANRSLQAIPTALNVQQNPLIMQQMAANTEATRFATERGRALLPGEIGQQQARIEQTLANVGLTTEQARRIGGLIQQDLAQTGRIQADTIGALERAGLTRAQIDQVKANTAATDISTLLASQAGRQQVIASQLDNLARAMELAGVEQAQNQRVINAEMAKWLEENPNLLNTFMDFMNMTQQTAVGIPGTEGMGGSLISAGGQLAGAAIMAAMLSDEVLKENIDYIGTTVGPLPVAIWRWNQLGERISGKSGWEIGFIAQDVQRIYPQAVFTGPDGFLRINLNELANCLRN